MSKNDRIDYLELPAPNIQAAKDFYGAAFGWEFVDYGPEYTSFKEQRLNGGLTQARKPAAPGEGALVVLHAEDLAATEAKVRAAGGKITTETFEFPGGRRFHFADPAGNELAVWSE
ncbi:MAG: putative enzyme related to lactoylglutathione lyase [Planctomycetota bacterium]|jgi:predicted enzyme related to lactoylglutathione lyase